MISIMRKTDKSSNGYIDIECEKPKALVYWGAFMNRPK